MKIISKRKRRSFYLIATSDIAFLLLIFLVVTASFEYSQDILPPEAEYVEDLDKKDESVAIEIDSAGNYSILSHPFSIDGISNILSNIPKSSVIKIFADKEVDFTSITRLLDALQTQDLYNVFLMMEQVKKE